MTTRNLTTQFAIFGAEPAFNEPLFVGGPSIVDRDKVLRKIGAALDRKRLTNDGPLVKEFEDLVARKMGVKHCIATSSATSGLQILISALELKGEVIVPAYTFIATAHALQWQGIRPVFADVLASNHLIDPESVEKRIGPQTSGILGVHLWGNLCDVASLKYLAEKHRLKLFFDAAHAFGCSFQGTSVGGFGEAEVLSFHATKVVNAFEGGAILTHSDTLARKLRRMRSFGFEGQDNVLSLGINAKMPEANAAMGIVGVENSSKILEAHKRRHARYREGLRSIPGLRLLEPSSEAENNYRYIVVEVNRDGSGLSRDEIVQVLAAENVIARKYFYPGCHRVEPYLTSLRGQARWEFPLPVTEKLADCVMVLPTAYGLPLKQIDKICSVLSCAIENSSEIRRQLAFLNSAPRKKSA